VGLGLPASHRRRGAVRAARPARRTVRREGPTGRPIDWDRPAAENERRSYKGGWGAAARCAGAGGPREGSYNAEAGNSAGGARGGRVETRPRRWRTRCGGAGDGRWADSRDSRETFEMGAGGESPVRWWCWGAAGVVPGALGGGVSGLSAVWGLVQIMTSGR
jgi:hypothetical protein